MTSQNNRAPVLCYASFVHYFKAISEFKLELQSGNTRFGSKSEIFLPRVNLKFYQWHWKTIEHILYATSNFVYHFITMVDSNWSYSPETLNLGQNRQFFCPVWLWYLNRWPWKIIAHLFYVTLSFVHHFIVIGEFKLESQSRNTQIGARFVLTSVTLTFDFWPGPFACTSLLSIVIAPENSWWYDGRDIVPKVSDGRTEVFLELLGCS